MGQITKFLRKGEVIKFSFLSRHSLIKQILLAVFLLLAFFMLFPMLQSGRQGFLLWLAAVIIIGYTLILAYRTKVYYLLTDQRLLAFLSYGSGNVRLGWQVDLSAISEVRRKDKNQIELVAGNKIYHLTNLRHADRVISRLRNFSEYM